MVACPWCGKEAMPHLRKATLGPARALKCQSCGKLVSVHPLAVFAALPAFVGGWIAVKSQDVPLGIAAVAAGLVLMFLLHAYVVPLVKR